MFKTPENRLPAASSALLESAGFLVPIDMRSDAKTSQ